MQQVERIGKTVGIHQEVERSLVDSFTEQREVVIKGTIVERTHHVLDLCSSILHHHFGNKRQRRSNRPFPVCSSRNHRELAEIHLLHSCCAKGGTNNVTLW